MIYAIVFIIGLLMGSFYNVCIYRIPREESIAFPPSHCTSCGTKLIWMDLIPVISYIFIKGKCRYCHEKISPKYPLVELLTGFIFLVLFVKFQLSWTFAAYTILSSILIIATLIDLKYQIIPDGLVIVGAIAGIILSISGLSGDWLNSLIGMLIGGGTFLLVAILSVLILKKEGMGGGDIKLMGMIGLFAGWKLTALSILLSIYLGGIIGGCLLLFRIKKRGDHIPYGPFIAIGTFIAILYGNEIIQWYLQKFL